MQLAVDTTEISDGEIRDRCIRLLDADANLSSRELAYNLISSFNLEKEDVRTQVKFLGRVLDILSDIIRNKSKGVFTEFG